MLSCVSTLVYCFPRRPGVHHPLEEAGKQFRTLKKLPVSKQSDEDAVRSVLSGFEKQVDLPNDLDVTMAEVRRRLEQTRRNFHRLKLRGTERRSSRPACELYIDRVVSE